jgi:hypothetical protein
MPLLLERCRHCGVDPARILRARHGVYAGVEFLRGGRKDARVIMPSLAYDTGILDALDWVLGLDQQGLFDKHLEALIKIRPQILAALRVP